MAADPKLIKKTDLARVREIDFTLMFTESLSLIHISEPTRRS